MVAPEQLKFSVRSLIQKQKLGISAFVLLLLFIAWGVQFGFFGRINRALNSADVSFYISDSQSSFAIAGATVESKGLEFKTDVQGLTTVNLMIGNQKVSITAEKYIKKELNLVVKRGNNETVNVLLNKLPATNAVISGVVVDSATQGPLAAVEIELVNSPVASRANSDQEGNFSIKVPDGKQILEFSLEGYNRQKQEIEAKTGKNTIVRIELNPS
ncbi:MAG: hypothetical protein A3F35_00285 [Candidatus Woykebacteria bacterium RIFCSPHIGHO2_12_FULL_45_10]|uniref:PEGA domain-containing protein n=1 Tax=Candidatus Woykebacteria bacterium RIFCSPHIGHO2_12_FULL_45_10 TaxID=1802603 RepID=A0A1G1WQ79_9BACT|nr:MAG: hypothetical protein A3F35_00285 [Candidatus Woykebacteria bacterium RIFCSPHIGHO2_12_FULL_45_10]